MMMILGYGTYGTRHEQVAFNEFLQCTGLGMRSYHGNFVMNKSEKFSKYKFVLTKLAINFVPSCSYEDTSYLRSECYNEFNFVLILRSLTSFEEF